MKKIDKNIKDNRKEPRISLHKENQVSGKIVIGNNCFVGRVYDLSINGLSLVFDDSVPLLDIDQEIELTILFSNNISYDVIATLKSKTEKKRFGFYCHSVKEERASVQAYTKLKLERVIECNIKDLIRLDQKYLFQLNKVSRHEFELITDSVDVFFFKDQEIYLDLLSFKKNRITGKILSVEVINNKTVLQLAINKLTSETEDYISSILFESSTYSPQEIAKTGFTIKNIKSNLKINFSSSYEDYLEVLVLRRLAYAKRGKASLSDPVEKFISELDDISRIIMLRHGSQLVASSAMTFPNSKDVKLDTEKAIQGGFPSGFINKTDCIEISRLCVHPSYQSSNAVVKIYRTYCQIFFNNTRNIIITSSDEERLSLYKKIGFEVTELSYNHLVFDGIRHFIIIYKKHNAILGKNMSLRAWLYLWAPIIDVYKKTHSIHLNLLNRLILNIKLYIYRCFKKFIDKDFA